MTKKNRGKKFPLLVYQRWGKMLRAPSLLIAIASGISWWYAPTNPELQGREWTFLIIAIIGVLIFIYSLLARRAAYVQCRANHLMIRTPFLPLAISYKRIIKTRSVEFHSQLSLPKMGRPQRRLLQPYLGRTTVLLEMRKLPSSKRQLRLWLPWYMFAKQVPGLVLLTDDWMTLSQQITSYSDRWTTGRLERQRAAKRLW
jgi:hypothetical protein